MKLYRNDKTITSQSIPLSRQLLERLKKESRRNQILVGIGTLSFTVAFVASIGFCAVSANNDFSDSMGVSKLEPIPVVDQVDEIIPFSAEIEEETISELEPYFEYYCSVYEIKKDIVYEKAQELTDSFTNTEWVLHNNIQGTKVIKENRVFDSKELGILAFVRHMKQVPTDFGFTKEQLATNQTYCMDTTYEEFTEAHCSLFPNLNPMLCQAIQYHESAHYTSPVFFEYHNAAGLKDSETGDYWRFRNPAESILELFFQLEYNYYVNSNLPNLSIEEQIIEIGPKYCPLDDEKDTLRLNPYWIDGVTDIYHSLLEQKNASNVK